MANRKGQDHGHWSEGLEQLEAQPEEARLPKLAPVTQNLLKHYLQESYEHDGEGNTIRKVHRGGKGEQPYTLNLHYDAENRLVKAVRPGRAGSVEAEYSYDPLGRRIAKRVREYAPVRGTGTHGPAAELVCQAERLTLFVWDGDRLVQEIQANQTVSYLYEPESFIPLAQVISDTPDTVYGPEAVRARQLREAEREASQTEVAAKLAWLEVADRKAWTLARSGEEERKRGEERTEREIREREGSRDRIYYLHGDHLGTPQEAVGEDGGVVWQAAYKAWGRIHRLEKGAISQPFRFQGQYEDEETGLYYNRHRYYDPDTARYLTQDPIGLLGGNNLYAYTPNSTGWVDPLGLAPKRPIDCKKGAMIFAEKKAQIEALIAEHDYKDSGHRNANPKIPGGVSGAIVYTAETGILVGGSDHRQKGQDILGRLKKTLKQADSAYDLCPQDRAKLHAMADPYINKLRDALAKPRAPLTGDST